MFICLHLSLTTISFLCVCRLVFDALFSFPYIYITIQYFLDVNLPAHWSKKIYILCHEETRQNAEELYTFFQGLGCECHLDTEEYDKVAECMPYRYVLENMKTAGHVLICISPKLKEAFEANRTKCKFKTLYEALDLDKNCTPAAARSSWSLTCRTNALPFSLISTHISHIVGPRYVLGP